MNANNCKVREIGPNPNRKPKLRKKPDKNRLIFIFAGTFIAFFLVFSVVASMMTPKINISGQSNVDEESLTQMSSDDFKGRVDQSLKDIEARESSGGYDISSRRTATSAKTATASQQANTVKQSVTDPALSQEQQMVNDSSATESMMPSDSQQPAVTPVKRINAASQIQQAPPKPSTPLVLRDKIRQSSPDTGTTDPNQ